jgi:hypothetical protein
MMPSMDIDASYLREIFMTGHDPFLAKAALEVRAGGL